MSLYSFPTHINQSVVANASCHCIIHQHAFVGKQSSVSHRNVLDDAILLILLILSPWAQLSTLCAKTGSTQSTLGLHCVWLETKHCAIKLWHPHLLILPGPLFLKPDKNDYWTNNCLDQFFEIFSQKGIIKSLFSEENVCC